MHKPILAGAIGLAVTACAPTAPEVGRASYDVNCAACHGSGGKGDGPAAANLNTQPADLTTLSARNGGEFPLVRVMAVIDGYSRRDPNDPMPEFGDTLHSATVLVDTEDGVLTPTPEWLVDLADYLRTIQQ